MTELTDILKSISYEMSKDRDQLVITNGISPLADIRDHDFRRGVVEGIRRAQGMLMMYIERERSGDEIAGGDGELPEMPEVDPESIN